MFPRVSFLKEVLRDGGFPLTRLNCDLLWLCLEMRLDSCFAYIVDSLEGAIYQAYAIPISVIHAQHGLYAGYLQKSYYCGHSGHKGDN